MSEPLRAVEVEVEVDDFEPTCTTCFESVELTPEVEARIGPTGSFTCDACLRRIWAAMMLTPHLDVCRSILRGRPVLARRLERAALVRAYRGEPLPAPEAHIRITFEMLDAIVEGGPFG